MRTSATRAQPPRARRAASRTPRPRCEHHELRRRGGSRRRTGRRQREELARQVDLADEVGVGDDRPRGVAHGLAEGRHHDQSPEQVDRVVADLALAQHQPHAHEVDAELHGGLDVGPAQAEHRGPVADPELLAHQEREQEAPAQRLPQATTPALDDQGSARRSRGSSARGGRASCASVSWPARSGRAARYGGPATGPLAQQPLVHGDAVAQQVQRERAVTPVPGDAGAVRRRDEGGVEPGQGPPPGVGRRHLALGVRPGRRHGRHLPQQAGRPARPWCRHARRVARCRAPACAAGRAAATGMLGVGAHVGVGLAGAQPAHLTEPRGQVCVQALRAGEHVVEGPLAQQAPPSTAWP